MTQSRNSIKREATFYQGLFTPQASYRGSTAASRSVKQETPIDLSSDSDDPSVPPSHHGLPTDEGYRSFSTPVEPRHRSTTSELPHRATNSMADTAHNRVDLQGFELVGKNVKILVDAITDLRTFGLSHVAPLPELVLVGDQSAGKSSLMSALTEVQLPRSQGACTRCPTNIKTSPAAVWSCRVSLQQDFRYVRSRAQGIKVTKNDPFPPWVPQDLVVKPFMTLENKADLEEAIRWAQLALLNHDEDSSAFIPGTGHRARNGFEHEREVTEAKFSPNLIAIDISGPDLPALSFYDLPGIFNWTSDPAEAYLCDVVENLARLYIKRPNALIIWPMAMKTDPANTKTGKVIRECGAEKRCVGVLTNPDHVKGVNPDYEKMLQGKHHVLKHGYFVTKQPGEDEHIDPGPGYHAEARRCEQNYFATQAPWTESWSQFREKCGTAAIQKFLSLELASSILSILPEIRDKIESEMERVDNELARCPDLPDTDVRNVILKNLSEFSSEVKTVMSGERPDYRTTFMSKWTTLVKDFSNVIKAIKPMIILKTPTEVININDDEDEEWGSVLPSIVSSGHKRGSESSFTTPAAKRVRDTVGRPSPIPIKLERTPRVAKPQVPSKISKEHYEMFKNSDFLGLYTLGRSFANLQEIRTMISDDVPAGMPGLKSPKTFDRLCTQAVCPWNQPLAVFLDRTVEDVHRNLAEILERCLGMYEKTKLYRIAQRHLKDLIENFAATQRTRLNDLYELELYKSFTVNEESVNRNKASELHQLQVARNLVRARDLLVTLKKKEPKKYKYTADMETDKQMAQQDTKWAKAIPDAELGTDPYENELDVAAYVRGYYITAGSRFVDMVCLSVQGFFFRSIRDLDGHLEAKLGIQGRDGEEICRQLMAEDDQIYQKRLKLRAKKEKLTGFNNRLRRLEDQLNLRQTPDESASTHTANGDQDTPMEDNIYDDDSRAFGGGGY